MSMPSTNYDMGLAVDLSADVPCEGAPEGAGPCEVPAVWRLTVLCCGHVWKFCDDHKAAHDALAKRASAACSVCRTPSPATKASLL